ncbi:hypothetical protein K504DRAFT_532230 [Pleomassaria siparia CBS 279.74]|uniref:Uncharacterized protein n=1 Tax=Pleomassaria siparia CBS 279.74 TaxID=1314801 RepID=A0A6G1KGZ6_9PLEO|nr:hypothetical protein K504DRAFT_532230 [Pleomassaria siparia CBS 279.74]
MRTTRSSARQTTAVIKDANSIHSSKVDNGLGKTQFDHMAIRDAEPISASISNSEGRRYQSAKGNSDDVGNVSTAPTAAESSSDIEAVSRKRAAPTDKRKAKAKRVSFADDWPGRTTGPSEEGPEYMTVTSEDDVKTFFRLATAPDSRLGDIHTLKIHLNAGNFSDYYDDCLAMALNAFHPRPDGINPHNLRRIVLVVVGSVLFCRYNYTLISPAASHDVKNQLHKLLTGDLSVEEKAKLPFKVNSTEKAIAKALLGIRGLEEVSIECQTRAKMEALFAHALRDTLTLPPTLSPANANGTAAVLVQSPVHCTTASSQSYKETLRPYPLRKYTHKPDSEHGVRVLLDENTMLLGHFADQDPEDTKFQAMTASKKLPKRRLTREESGIVKVSTGTLGRVTGRTSYGNQSVKRRKVKRETLDERDAVVVEVRRVRGEEGGLHDMVRIGAKQQDGEDLGQAKGGELSCFIDQKVPGEGTPNGEWLALTGKGGMATMGWRTW